MSEGASYFEYYFSHFTEIDHTHLIMTDPPKSRHKLPPVATKSKSSQSQSTALEAIPNPQRHISNRSSPLRSRSRSPVLRRPDSSNSPPQRAQHTISSCDSNSQHSMDDTDYTSYHQAANTTPTHLFLLRTLILGSKRLSSFYNNFRSMH